MIIWMIFLMLLFGVHGKGRGGRRLGSCSTGFIFCNMIIKALLINS